jgi:hypothetical protein
MRRAGGSFGGSVVISVIATALLLVAITGAQRPVHPQNSGPPPWPAPARASVPIGVRAAGLTLSTVPGVVTRYVVHLDVQVNGKPVPVPAGIGIDWPAHQLAPLYTDDGTGVIHVASNAQSPQFTLGEFFDEWGIPLSSTQVGSATGKVTVFFTSPGQQSKLYTGDPRDIPLGDHYEIQLVVGTPIVAPVKVTDWYNL